MRVIQRNIAANLLEALSDSPVVLLNGARQTGKSTLVQWLATAHHPARYVTLDDATALAAARSDPAGFLAGFEGPLVLDEVQRAPDLFLALKAEVDRKRQPGRFLLTGSADVLLLPHLSESLAGRMEILTLWPFSQGELAGVRETFINTVFSATTSFKTLGSKNSNLVQRILQGGYPETIARNSSKRRRAWFGSYLTTLIQRDVRDLANIEHLTTMPRLLSLLAARSASLLNYTEMATSLGLPQTTLKRYMGLLEATFLVQLLPAWSANLGQRLVKSPKLLLSDTGLIAHLLGLDPEYLVTNPTLFGPLLETFVVMELRKQSTWSSIQPSLFHFRTQMGQEVDLVLEDASGRIVGLEIKAASTVGNKDFKGLQLLSEALGKRFVRGVVLYTGSEIVPFGPRLLALPIDTLWQ